MRSDLIPAAPDGFPETRAEAFRDAFGPIGARPFGEWGGKRTKGA